MLSLDLVKGFVGKYVYAIVGVLILGVLSALVLDHYRIEALRADNALLKTQLSTAESVNKDEVGQVEHLAAKLTEVTKELKAQGEAAVAAAAAARADQAKLAAQLAATRTVINDAKKDPDCAQLLAQRICPRILDSLRAAPAAH